MLKNLQIDALHLLLNQVNVSLVNEKKKKIPTTFVLTKHLNCSGNLILCLIIININIQEIHIDCFFFFDGWWGT